MTKTPTQADLWRSTASLDNPAGPLFSSRYAEADLTARSATGRDTHVSSCSGSFTIDCC